MSYVHEHNISEYIPFESPDDHLVVLHTVAQEISKMSMTDLVAKRVQAQKQILINPADVRAHQALNLIEQQVRVYIYVCIHLLLLWLETRGKGISSVTSKFDMVQLTLISEQAHGDPSEN